MSHTVNPQRQAFNDDGYVAYRQFFTGEPFDELMANVFRLLDSVLPSIPAEHMFFEDKNDPTSLKQIQQIGSHDSWFNNLFLEGPFRTVAEDLLNGPVVPKNFQYFNKPPVVSKPTPPHQDGHYFMLNPCEAVTLWFALDDADEENGCVRYVRGSHKLPMRPHGRTKTLGFSQGIVDYPNEGDTQNEVAVVAQPGDLLVHHANTIHRADHNRSAIRNRRALGFIYYSERAREDTKAHRVYQDRLREEMKAAGKL